MSGAKRIGLTLASLILLLVLAAAVALWLYLRASLPELDGRVDAPVAANVAIERDALGVPTLRASSRTDLYFAQGFVHAQERYFQMDLSRRVAAGRLSELFGARALEADKAMRVHGLALVADAAIAAMPASHRERSRPTLLASTQVLPSSGRGRSSTRCCVRSQSRGRRATASWCCCPCSRS